MSPIPKSADINGRIRVNDKGQKEIFAKAGTALTAKTMYRLQHDEDGVEVVVLAAGAVPYMCCIPEASIASASSGWVVIQGLVEDAIIPSTSATKGYAFKIHSGAITSLGAAWAFAATEVGVYCETISSATTCNLFLAGREATPTA